MQINVTLELPEEAYNKYNERAENKDITGVLSAQLTKCADYTSERPIYITDSQRQRLESILGYNVFTAEQLIKLVERLSAINIGKVKVDLSADLLGRLQSRCFDTEDFDGFIKNQVTRDLETFVGLR